MLCAIGEQSTLFVSTLLLLMQLLLYHVVPGTVVTDLSKVTSPLHTLLTGHSLQVSRRSALHGIADNYCLHPPILSMRGIPYTASTGNLSA